MASLADTQAKIKDVLLVHKKKAADLKPGDFTNANKSTCEKALEVFRRSDVELSVEKDGSTWKKADGSKANVPDLREEIVRALVGVEEDVRADVYEVLQEAKQQKKT